MKIFESTDLPDDFVQQVVKHRKLERPGDPDATWNAILVVLGRPLTGAEKLALVDAVHAGRINSTTFGVVPDVNPVHSS
jgi:hypothetical protein